MQKIMKKTVKTNQYGVTNCNGAGLPLKKFNYLS